MKETVIFNALQTSLSGGIGRYCLEIAKAIYMDKDDIDFKIVIREEDIKDYSFVKEDDLIIIKGIENGLKRNIYEQFRLPKEIYMKYPNAIIHYPDTMAPIFAKNRVITTMHDMAFRTLKNEFSFKTKVWKNFITKKSVNKVDKIIAITKFTKDEIKRYYPHIENKINVVYNGFNDFSNEAVNVNNLGEKIKNIKEKYILSVNTITPRKNIDGIIKAFYKIKDKTDAKLIIAGKNGWKSEEIINLVDEFDIKDRVIFTGKINDDELKYLYKNTSLYVYISFYEGFGLSPLEAMSFGAPTITSNVTSIPEVVGERAKQVDPYNIDEISEEMFKILEDPSYLNIIKENMKKDNIDFSWDKCAKETIKVYKEMFK